MNIENIKKLITHLETIPDDHYDSRSWSHDKECGCAIFHMKDIFPEIKTKERSTATWGYIVIKDREYTGYPMVAKILDIPIWRSVNIFKEENDRTKVIRLLNNLMEEHNAEPTT